MFWIGLTGGLASGKSSVAEILKNKNIPVVNADLLAREAVRPGSEGLKQVVELFGSDILMPDGSLDRKKLAAKVFGQTSSLAQLESILHPIIRRLANDYREKLAGEGQTIAFYDVPLLFEKKMESLFDQIVLVKASEENQIRRAILRDGLLEKEVRSRLAHQLPLEQKVKFAHYVIENDGNLNDLELKVDEVLAKLTSPKNNLRSK